MAGSDITPFGARLGVGGGRVLSIVNEIPESGQNAFVLGEDLEGFKAEFEIGDFDQVTRDVDVTTLDLIRFGQLVFRAPLDALAASLAWELSVLLEGAKEWQTLGYPGQTRTIEGVTLDVSALTGSRSIGIRLEVVAAP